MVNATSGGPAKARNLGARSARGTILFFVDADVTIPPDAIGFIETLYHHEPALAACIGSYDDAPAAPNFLSQYKNLLHHYVHQMGRKEASTFWGACGAIRRDIFLKLGGFDERYTTPCIEDIELGYRLVRDGYQIQLRKELQVKHLKRWEAHSLLYADFFRRAIPWTELILRDRRMVNDLNLQHSGRLSVVSAYGLLSALVAAVIWPRMLACAGACGVSLVLLNASLYRFFIHKRGLWFALRAIPWHWLYFLYSGLAFGIGVLRFLGSRPSDSRARDKR